MMTSHKPAAPRRLAINTLYTTLVSSVTAATLLVVWMGNTADTVAQPSSDIAVVDELTVERINVQEPDGTLRMVISNLSRAPDPVFDGRTMSRPGGDAAGIIIYNDEGNECGGMVYGLGELEGRQVAGSGLYLDRYGQDQVVGMSYNEYDGDYYAGISVWDRPEESIGELFEELESLKEPHKSQVVQRMSEQGRFGAKRAFFGRREQGDAALVLQDRDGRPRLVLSVGDSGAAEITFLDAEGNTVHHLSPEGRHEP